jgi:hypothetical protein
MEEQRDLTRVNQQIRVAAEACNTFLPAHRAEASLTRILIAVRPDGSLEVLQARCVPGRDLPSRSAHALVNRAAVT